MTDDERRERTSELANAAAGNFDETMICLNAAAFLLARMVVIGGDARATVMTTMEGLVAQHETQILAARRRASH